MKMVIFPQKSHLVSDLGINLIYFWILNDFSLSAKN